MRQSRVDRLRSPGRGDNRPKSRKVRHLDRVQGKKNSVAFVGVQCRNTVGNSGNLATKVFNIFGLCADVILAKFLEKSLVACVRSVPPPGWKLLWSWRWKAMKVSSATRSWRERDSGIWLLECSSPIMRTWHWMWCCNLVLNNAGARAHIQWMDGVRRRCLMCHLLAMSKALFYLTQAKDYLPWNLQLLCYLKFRFLGCIRCRNLSRY